MKLLAAILIDLFDFTVCRFIGIPLVGEVIGIAAGYYLFGPIAFLYAFEALDPTGRFDAYVPMATIIAIKHYAGKATVRSMEQAQQTLRDQNAEGASSA